MNGQGVDDGLTEVCERGPSQGVAADRDESVQSAVGQHMKEHEVGKVMQDWDVNDGASPLDRIAFFNRPVITENYGPDIIGLKIERHSDNSTGKFD